MTHDLPGDQVAPHPPTTRCHGQGSSHHRCSGEPCLTYRVTWSTGGTGLASYCLGEVAEIRAMCLAEKEQDPVMELVRGLADLRDNEAAPYWWS